MDYGLPCGNRANGRDAISYYLVENPLNLLKEKIPAFHYKPATLS